MPVFEAPRFRPDGVIKMSLDGLKIELGHHLGEFIMPRGFSVVVPCRVSFAEKIDVQSLGHLLRQAQALEFPSPYPVCASSREGVGMVVETYGHHEVNILRLFWRAHNQRVIVRPSASGDNEVYRKRNRSCRLSFGNQLSSCEFFDASD